MSGESPVLRRVRHGWSIGTAARPNRLKFAAVRKSANGTKQTFRGALAMSALRGKADIVLTTCEIPRDQSLVDARDRSFQSAPCFCQFIRIWRLVLLFLPSAADWLSATQWNRTIAAGPTTRICGSRYSSDRNFDFPLVALAMKVALSSTRPSEWL